LSGAIVETHENQPWTHQDLKQVSPIATRTNFFSSYMVNKRVEESITVLYDIILPYLFIWGTLLVAQLFEALCYKPEDRGFDSR
jgi:hypothetical protein